MDLVDKKQIAALFAKKHITVLITDSGLGGLSIFAEFAARLKADPIFPEVTLIYYNAWPEQNRGYHKLGDMDERIRIFDRALEGMLQYRPDIIMIACNTLSILYDHTEFSRRKPVPVIDIVHFGVDMVADALSEHAVAKAVLFGTVITIASDVHWSLLVKKGIAADRLVVQPCDQLATWIEKGPHSEAVVQLIDTFTDQAAAKLGLPPSKVFAALICTHFGYCRELIRTKLENRIQKPVTMLDPNQRMASFLFEAHNADRHARTAVDMHVVSRIIWDQTKISAIAPIIEKQSPETAQALRSYEHNPHLFVF